MEEQKATNVVWHEHKVEREQREQLLKQKGVVVWFTGLSGSGKSTVANEVAYKLQEKGKLAYILDGDNQTEHIKMHISPKWIGKSVTFTMKVKGDTLIQSGIVPAKKLGLWDSDYELYEVYKRLD